MRRAEKRPVRFAVVGQGYFAQSSILPAFDNAKGCELTAIFSDDRSKLRALKRKYGVEHALDYDEYDDFLRSGAVDAVYIALPNDLHCDYTVRAAAAGVHVLCEKPMAVTSAECERMIAACERGGVKLMIAYRLHFEAANMSAVELVQGGKIGDARFFSSIFAQQVSEGNIRTADTAHGGGPVYDIGIYCINAARYIFRAEPVEVTALAERKRGDKRFSKIDEQVSVLLRFPDQRLAQLTCSFGAADVGSYTVMGTKGRLHVDPAYEVASDLAWELEVGGKTREKTFKKRDQVAPELLAFADCIRNGGDPEPSGREGLADIRVIEAIHRSLQTGRPVPIDVPPRRRRPSLRQARKLPAHGMPELVGVQPPSKG
jgi:predicted dehydrogenase